MGHGKHDGPLSLQAIRERYIDHERPFPKALEAELVVDPRPGAQAILRALENRRQRNRQQGQRLRRITRFEREQWSLGRVVAGVDEVGMSPLAGPVAAAAVILPIGYRHPGIDDSKRLSPMQRNRMSAIIRRDALDYAVGWVDAPTIDRINIYHAGILAMTRAVARLALAPAHILVDARTIPDMLVEQQSIVHGDARSISIAAASIVAKVARDTAMRTLEYQYPGYGLARHKGYPVRAHREALYRLGPTPIHRRSFTEVRLAEGRGW